MKQNTISSSAPNPFGILAVILLAIALFTAPKIHAEDAGFSAGGTLVSTNLSYVPVPVGPGTPEVMYLSATSDTNTAKVTFYKVSASTIVTNAVGSGTNTVYFSDTSAFSASDVCLLRNGVSTNGTAINTANYQRLIISSVSPSNIVFTANTSLGLVAGDVLYRMTSRGTIPVGNATKEVIGHCYTGRNGEPLLVEVNGAGTNTVSVNSVNGLYR